MKYKSTGSSVKDYAEMPVQEFSRRKLKGLRNGWDSKDYDDPSPTKVKGISK